MGKLVATPWMPLLNIAVSLLATLIYHLNFTVPFLHAYQTAMWLLLPLAICLELHPVLSA